MSWILTTVEKICPTGIPMLMMLLRVWLHAVPGVRRRKAATFSPSMLANAFWKVVIMARRLKMEPSVEQLIAGQDVWTWILTTMVTTWTGMIQTIPMVPKRSLNADPYARLQRVAESLHIPSTNVTWRRTAAEGFTSRGPSVDWLNVQRHRHSHHICIVNL